MVGYCVKYNLGYTKICAELGTLVGFKSVIIVFWGSFTIRHTNWGYCFAVLSFFISFPLNSDCWYYRYSKNMVERKSKQGPWLVWWIALETPERVITGLVSNCGSEFYSYFSILVDASFVKFLCINMMSYCWTLTKYQMLYVTGGVGVSQCSEEPCNILWLLIRSCFPDKRNPANWCHICING